MFKQFFLLYFLLIISIFGAPTYQEFYVQTTGSNLNSGSTNTDSPTIESTNGDWGSVTANRFTAASGTPFSAVSIGDYASIYLDGASLTNYIARVTAVNGGGSSIDLSPTANAGTTPATGVTGRTCRIGGAWSGPAATVDFPFNFAEDDLIDSSGNSPRVNFKNGVTYSINDTINHSLNGPLIFSGYTTTPGDGGRAIIDGGSSGARYILLYVYATESPSLVTVGFHNFIFQNNGSTGSGEVGVHANINQTHWYNCVFRDISGSGLKTSGATSITSCEFYNCNQSNRSSHGGLDMGGAGSNAFFCYSHHNLGANSDGFIIGTKCHVIHSISFANGRHGYHFYAGSASSSIQQSDAYLNTGSGINFAAGGTVVIENTNLIDNGAYGINFGGYVHQGMIANCGFGSGTAANTSGAMSTSKGIEVIGTVTYPSNSIPWSGAATGDFDIDLPEAQNAGRGEYRYTSGTALTVGSPDIGAAQSSSGGNTSPTVSISSPTNGASVSSPVTFIGVATDAEDGTISSSITWSSNVDGSLGTGATISPSLTAGSHTITASITDSGTSTDTDQINITVSTAPRINTTTLRIAP